MKRVIQDSSPEFSNHVRFANHDEDEKHLKKQRAWAREKGSNGKIRI